MTDMISIHAPREGRDRDALLDDISAAVFQSTRPARGATSSGHTRSGGCGFQSVAPREGRDGTGAGGGPNGNAISIHAPREGRDQASVFKDLDNLYFNPRAPRGARRTAHSDKAEQLNISIHAPREGRDDVE